MYVQEANLFNGLSQDCLNGLAKIMQEETYSKGDFIFKEGDPADTFYVLEEGKVRLCVGDLGHIVYIVSDQGSAFGWSSLVDRDCYTTSAECVTACTIIRIGKEQLTSLFTTHLSDGLHFYKRLADNIGQRLLNGYSTILSAQHVEAQPSYG